MPNLVMSTVPTAHHAFAEASPISGNDPVLHSLIEAQEHAARDLAMEHLLVSVALPVIGSVVRRKSGRFGVRLRFRSEDEDDIRAAAMYRVVRRLSADLRAHPVLGFENYVAAVAAHVCDEYFRRYSPEWTLLRRRLRALLREDARFALWTEDSRIYCGRADWRDRPPAIRVEPGRVSELVPHHESLADALDAVFAAIGAPLLVTEAVAVLAPHYAFVGTRSAFPETAEDGPLPSDVLETRETAAEVWREICHLPVEQRRALLLSLRDAQRRSALRYFPLTGVATIRDIAAALEWDVHRFAELWPQLPMQDTEIARLLATTRQRVINLRAAARQRLSRRLGREGGR
jgi:hypothetical protein